MGRQMALDTLHHNIDQNIDQIHARWQNLQTFILEPGIYVDLFKEARMCYILGCCYSCVAMCGVSSERLGRDLYEASLMIRNGARVEPPSIEVLKILSRTNFSIIINYLIEAGLINETVSRHMRQLSDLRNRYAHGSGQNPEADAKTALDHLHGIVDGTKSLVHLFLSPTPPVPVVTATNTPGFVAPTESESSTCSPAPTDQPPQ